MILGTSRRAAARACVVLTIAGLLAACGGGGGSDNLLQIFRRCAVAKRPADINFFLGEKAGPQFAVGGQALGPFLHLAQGFHVGGDPGQEAGHCRLPER